MKDNRLDAAIIDQHAASHVYWQEDLFSECYYAIVSLQHSLACLDAVTIEQLSKETLILHQAPCNSRTHLLTAFKQSTHQSTTLDDVPFGDYIFGLVMANRGITMMTELAAMATAHLPLKGPPIKDAPLQRIISLVAKNKNTGQKLLHH
ncbi:LysR family transcriptional regulator [Fictibacillus macauensis ZFHKF-1]|uniref:LysR family transcriptional regulator n=1 Tax=Fictibacillus macauensis ZFHKF-1 TaxID=1196324 RepID=I8UI47_9BACL|nr:LysR family transcriptional regulator [Fictibacillus macauensis ZFHKF-1]